MGGEAVGERLGLFCHRVRDTLTAMPQGDITCTRGTVNVAFARFIVEVDPFPTHY